MDQVRDELVRLLQDYAVEAQRLQQVFAERNGMHPTDLHALLAVMRADAATVPLTPGRLGAHLGLSSGATTAVIDRLERGGHVSRVPDPRDRRRVIVHVGRAAGQVGAAFFGPLGVAMDEMLTGYDAEELMAVKRFLGQMNDTMREHRQAFSA
ncbi:MarR family winged helix-turn-helix transcriptional regulator [Pseudonocardia sp. GCM10023141]|uniref:MarR family winged helix-turn-helix transcriptional regulator n=1 Tax=Pseudonocardia sp. GCM10023141 TaxID=3252653 RepID=UPI0036189567